MLAFHATMTAAILGAIGLGGGLYEAVLIDRSWPRMPMLIQPARGGINRKLFWAPIHGLFELALVAAIWATWREPDVRCWVLAAFSIHVIVRISSFAYFIPLAMRFEAGSADDPEATAQVAGRWVRLSRWRLPFEFVAILCLIAALAPLSAPEIPAVSPTIALPFSPIRRSG
ncbi:hypothetical protein [Sphingomonas lycopersici]|uniref:Uncharacterized protein n=1 Tax=Sphingomonas lycopersici TaxID=2951807 RepID=A0AA41ZBU7_9SPHN|nr:hypothetical protein [Sphingomonas lycopersici]MCW6537607.1 hypothetical protein [Sphingomonas lycopersici]